MGNRIALLLCLACLTGCVRKVETSVPSAAVTWEYHIERVENVVRKDEAEWLKNKESADAGKFKDAVIEDTVRPGQIEMSADQLNKLGKDGWELCASFVEPETVQPSAIMKAANTRAGAAVLIFKRPVRN